MTRPADQHDVVRRLEWYARRLSSMTPSELLWRACRVVQGVLPRSDISTAPDSTLLRATTPDWETALQSFRQGLDRPVLLDRTRAAAIAATCPSHVAGLVAAAERVAFGRVSYFGYPEVDLGSRIDWHHDPVADVRWPEIPSSKIDHRVARGDVKWIWELNRLQHLPWLAQAWLFTGQKHFAEVALDHLDTWIDQNPVGHGIAWRGAFEAGVRAISVAVALQGLRDCDLLTVDRFERASRMLAASADLCWRDRSRYSSANNHLIGELAGLASVAMLLPELRASPRWERRALDALAREASLQILPDGSGAEQAVGYQVFSSELLLVVAALLRARGDQPPPAVTAAIDRSADFLAAVVGTEDPEPRYGDDDEGFALRLGPEPVRTVRDHLGIVAAFTGNERAARVGDMTLSAAWMKALTAPRLEGLPALDRTSRSGAFCESVAARSGGLVVLRSAGRRLTMDVGPLGYLSIAAHGHADALAVTMSVNGQELIGDPGAASYYGHPEWRRVHRGTRVHPTVTVDGEDQSVIAGPFMWAERARVRLRAVDLGRGVVDAEHDGYRRLSAPVTHRRWLIAPPEDETVVVVDLVEGEGEHEVRTSWPLHPSLDIRADPAGHLVSKDDVPLLQLAYAASAELAVDQVRGDTENHLGWWSHRLEARTPSWLVSGTSRGRVPLAVVTVLRPLSTDRSGFVTGLGVDLKPDKVVATWQEGGPRRRLVVERSLPGAAREMRSAPEPAE